MIYLEIIIYFVIPKEKNITCMIYLEIIINVVFPKEKDGLFPTKDT